MAQASIGRRVAWVAAGALATATAAGIVVSEVGAASASGVAAANPAQPAAQSSTAPAKPHERWRHGGPGFGGPGFLGALGNLAGLGRPVAGDITLAKPGGGTSVVHFQVGTISAPGTNGFDVSSPGLPTKHYTTSAGTHIVKDGQSVAASALAKGDHVIVITDASETVLDVLDGMPPRDHGPRGMPPAPPAGSTPTGA